MSSYVPNDTFLVGGKSEEELPGDVQEASDNAFETQEPVQRPSMLLLTGPNYSGKSVYMKQGSLLDSIIGLWLIAV